MSVCHQNRSPKKKNVAAHLSNLIYSFYIIQLYNDQVEMEEYPEQEKKESGQNSWHLNMKS